MEAEIPDELSISLKERDTFYDNVIWSEGYSQLLNHMPGIYAWVKDREGRFMMANKNFLEASHMPDEAELIGKTDFDIWPDNLAEDYVKDDQIVMKTGESILARVEFAISLEDEKVWFSTTKIPLKNKKGKVLGVAGFSFELKKSGFQVNPIMKMVPAINYLQSHYSRNIDIKEVAKEMDMSLDDFKVKFRRILRISPEDYLLQIRVEKSISELIHNRHSIKQISINVGYEDEAEFSHDFATLKGKTPSEFRDEYAEFASDSFSKSM